MRTVLFENPKNALIFGGVILLGAVVLIGEENDEGALATAGYSDATPTPAFASGANAGIREYAPPGSEAENDTGTGWTSENDLVDEASGTDAAPMDRSGSVADVDAETAERHSKRPPGIDGPTT